MIFTNGRLIFPDGIRDRLELVVEHGKIANVRRETGAHGEEVVDLAGNYLAPGFVDLHVHGAVGHDTMEATPEAFRAICDYHAGGGSTSLLLTTASAPLDATPKGFASPDYFGVVDVLNAVRQYRSSVRQIAGVHVEGPFIAKAKKGAQREEFICEPTPESVATLLEHVDVIKRITLAPELSGALDAIENFSAHGISVSGGHSDAWEEEARAGFDRGMRSVTHTFNCMSSARRRGVHRAAGLLEFALSEPEINCELIADGHHVLPTLMKTLYRAKGAHGISLVTDATAGAGLADESHFSLYGNDCVVEHGVCLLADRSVLAGSASRMIDLVRTIVRDVDVPLYEAVAMATLNPANAVGLKSKGRLEAGADGDLVVLSPELDVLKTFAAGTLIYEMTKLE
jgi:N-acetylglucosamine-6-phosphate deacetylase